ncbi:MAG: hypothetical protein AABZ94_06235 [Candidatus Eisenbacteria bacterium]
MLLTASLICLVAMPLTAGLAEAAKTKGKIRKDVYMSPAKNFSVPVPRGLGMRVNDSYASEEGIGGVSFHDDFGNQSGILFMRIPAEAARALDDPATRRQALESFLEAVALPTWFLPASRDARIVHQEFAGSRDSVAFMGLVSIPGGSTAMDMKTGKRLDSARAVLTLYHDGFVYVLTTEVGGGAFAVLDKEQRDPKDQLAAGSKKLFEFLGTIRFQVPNH